MNKIVDMLICFSSFYFIKTLNNKCWKKFDYKRIYILMLRLEQDPSPTKTSRSRSATLPVWIGGRNSFHRHMRVKPVCSGSRPCASNLSGQGRITRDPLGPLLQFKGLGDPLELPCWFLNHMYQTLLTHGLITGGVHGSCGTPCR